MRLAGDAEHLIERLEYLLVLMPHVAGIDPVVGGDLPGQLDKLVRLRENPGMIDQAGGEAYRAVLHRLPHQGLHPVELRRRGRAVEVAAHGLLADIIVAHERCHVDRHPGPVYLAKELRHVQR